MFLFVGCIPSCLLSCLWHESIASLSSKSQNPLWQNHFSPLCDCWFLSETHWYSNFLVIDYRRISDYKFPISDFFLIINSQFWVINKINYNCPTTTWKKHRDFVLNTIIFNFDQSLLIINWLINNILPSHYLAQAAELQLQEIIDQFASERGNLEVPFFGAPPGASPQICQAPVIE